ncbi:MAG TPA: hypothetical protein VJY62_22190 [Bacteroidia bacterium]|nr:hypothetical protein [Bacteroidia bacterium]
MGRKINSGLALIGCFIWSCSQSLYMPASTDSTKQQELLAGRKLYVDHCSNCHNLHLPKEYDAAGWKKQLDEMQVKAKITDEEKQLIFQYLTSQP